MVIEFFRNILLLFLFFIILFSCLTGYVCIKKGYYAWKTNCRSLFLTSLFWTQVFWMILFFINCIQNDCGTNCWPLWIFYTGCLFFIHYQTRYKSKYYILEREHLKVFVMILLLAYFNFDNLLELIYEFHIRFGF